MLKILGLGLAVVILWTTFRKVDFARVVGLIDEIGWGLLAILVPYLLAMSFDTMGWRFAFSNLGRRVAFPRLLRVRLISEAVLMSITAGALVSDSVTPYLLKKHAEVPVTEGLVAMAVRKCLIFLADGIYVLVAVVVGWAFLVDQSRALIGIPGLVFFGIGSSVFLVASSAVTALTLTRASVATKLHRALTKIPSRRLRAMLHRWEDGFHETDRHFSESFGLARVHFPLALGAYLTSWFMEALETWLILQLLGVDLSYLQVLSFEALLSLVRSIVFVVPAGLGVQDVGYVAFLKAYGVADPVTVGAAFVLLKRAKEVVWILLGYGLLLFGQAKKGLVIETEPAIESGEQTLTSEVRDGTF